MASYKRILLKLSGGAMGDDSNIFSSEALQHVANEITKASNTGIEIAIVVGGGNIFRGRIADEWNIERAEADNIGMLATVMNALILKQILNRRNLKCHVMTPFSFSTITELFSKDLAKDYLSKGEIVIFGGGIGQPFMSTDYPSIQRSLEIQADVVLMAKEGVNGVYTADPNSDPNAKKYKSLSYDVAIERRIMVADQTAFLLAREHKMPIVIFDFFEKNAVSKICNGKKIGTYIGDGCATKFA